MDFLEINKGRIYFKNCSYFSWLRKTLRLFRQKPFKEEENDFVVCSVLIKQVGHGVCYNQVKNNKGSKRKIQWYARTSSSPREKDWEQYWVMLSWEKVTQKWCSINLDMVVYKWVSRTPKYYSGTTLSHSTMYSQFSLYPEDMCEKERVIEIQACLQLEWTEIFELTGVSIPGGLYWH